MTIRDADRIRDKLEVSLDGRQVFFLFFGGAVVACLVFVLGVMVGKRLEGRERVAHKAATSAAVDPLAALDELGADEKADGKVEELAFPRALASPRPAAEAAKPAAKPAADATKPAAKPPADAKPADAKPPEAAKPVEAKPAEAKPAEAKPAEAKPVEAKPAEAKVADAKPEAKPAADAKPAPETTPANGRFTLQISSFQDRAEAE